MRRVQKREYISLVVKNLIKAWFKVLIEGQITSIQKAMNFNFRELAQHQIEGLKCAQNIDEAAKPFEISVQLIDENTFAIICRIPSNNYEMSQQFTLTHFPEDLQAFEQEIKQILLDADHREGIEIKYSEGDIEGSCNYKPIEPNSLIEIYNTEAMSEATNGWGGSMPDFRTPQQLQSSYARSVPARPAAKAPMPINKANAVLKLLVDTPDKKNINLAEFPGEPRLIKPDSNNRICFTYGDTHGNIMRIIHLFFSIGLLYHSNQATAKKCYNQLSSSAQSLHNVLKPDPRREIPENQKRGVKQALADFQQVLSQLTKHPYYREYEIDAISIGDATGDRNYVDILYFYLKKYGESLQINMPELVSNHGIKTTAYLERPKDYHELRSCHNSLGRMMTLVKSSLITLEEVKDLYQNHVAKSLQLIRMEVYEDHCVLYSHAPMLAQSIFWAAYHYDQQFVKATLSPNDHGNVRKEELFRKFMQEATREQVKALVDKINEHIVEDATQFQLLSKKYPDNISFEEYANVKTNGSTMDFEIHFVRQLIWTFELDKDANEASVHFFNRINAMTVNGHNGLPRANVKGTSEVTDLQKLMIDTPVGKSVSRSSGSGRKGLEGPARVVLTAGSVEANDSNNGYTWFTPALFIEARQMLLQNYNSEEGKKLWSEKIKPVIQKNEEVGQYMLFYAVQYQNDNLKTLLLAEKVSADVVLFPLHKNSPYDHKNMVCNVTANALAQSLRLDPLVTQTNATTYHGGGGSKPDFRAPQQLQSSDARSIPVRSAASFAEGSVFRVFTDEAHAFAYLRYINKYKRRYQLKKPNDIYKIQVRNTTVFGVHIEATERGSLRSDLNEYFISWNYKSNKSSNGELAITYQSISLPESVKESNPRAIRRDIMVACNSISHALNSDVSPNRLKAEAAIQKLKMRRLETREFFQEVVNVNRECQQPTPVYLFETEGEAVEAAGSYNSSSHPGLSDRSVFSFESDGTTKYGIFFKGQWQFRNIPDAFKDTYQNNYVDASAPEAKIVLSQRLCSKKYLRQQQTSQTQMVSEAAPTQQSQGGNRQSIPAQPSSSQERVGTFARTNRRNQNAADTPARPKRPCLIQ